MKKVIFMLGLCLVLLGTVIGCGDDDTTTSDEGQLGELKCGLEVVVAETEEQVGGMVKAMDLLTMTEEVRSGDWERMVGLLTKLKEDNLTAAIWYVLPDGSYWTVEKGAVEANLSDRDYFPGLMGGETQLGDVVVSKSTGKTSLIAAVPVEVDGDVVGGLGASIFLEDLSAIIMNELPARLSPDMVFYALNDRGEVVLHSDAVMIMTDGAEPGGKVLESQGSELLGWTFYLAEAE